MPVHGGARRGTAGHSGHGGARRGTAGMPEHAGVRRAWRCTLGHGGHAGARQGTLGTAMHDGARQGMPVHIGAWRCMAGMPEHARAQRADGHECMRHRDSPTTMHGCRQLVLMMGVQPGGVVTCDGPKGVCLMCVSCVRIM
jgi:hypothetical protein